jgi:hypothetical protein
VIDPDTAGAAAVHIYEGNCCTNPKGAFTAAVPRADVGNAWPYYGNDHGFDVFIPLSPGFHMLCAYAINYDGTLGGNKDLGCRNATVN